MQSMTGFGSSEANVPPLGKINVELRSVNHKFLECSIHLPEGLAYLEEKIKKELESKIKRGRVICSVNLAAEKAPSVCINDKLLKNYLRAFKDIRKNYGIKDDISLNTLIGLPGVLGFGENGFSRAEVWHKIKALFHKALADLSKTRAKEGRSTFQYLKNRQESLTKDLVYIKARFKKALAGKVKSMVSDEDKANFINNSDISEEIARLMFHAGNFRNKITKNGPIGKELDFIAQEMQREANTLAAKSFDIAVSSKVVQVKSTIEKIREQAQNVE